MTKRKLKTGCMMTIYHFEESEMNATLSTILKSGGSLWVGRKGTTTLCWAADRNRFVIDPSFTLRGLPNHMLEFERLYDALREILRMYKMDDVPNADTHSALFMSERTNASVYLNEYAVTFYSGDWYVLYIPDVETGASNSITHVASLVLSRHGELNEALHELVSGPSTVLRFEDEVLGDDAYLVLNIFSRGYNIWKEDDTWLTYANERIVRFPTCSSLVNFVESAALLDSSYAATVFDLMLLYSTEFIYRGSIITPIVGKGTFQMKKGGGLYSYNSLKEVMDAADAYANGIEQPSVVSYQTLRDRLTTQIETARQRIAVMEVSESSAYSMETGQYIAFLTARNILDQLARKEDSK